VWTGGGVTVTAEKGEASRSMSSSSSSSTMMMMMMPDDPYSLQHRTLADQIKQHSDTSSSSSSSLFDIVRRRCVTGGYGDRQIGVSSLSVSGQAVNRDDDDDGDGEEGDQQYDAFEDLQTGEKFSGRSNKPNNDDEDDEDEDEEDQERRNEIIDQELREINARKKASFKASFDRRYDEKLLVSPR
jgi:hypothetical protein